MEALRSRIAWVLFSVVLIVVLAFPFFTPHAVSADFRPARLDSVAKFLVSAGVTVAVVALVLVVLSFVRLLASKKGHFQVEKEKFPVPLWAKIFTLVGGLACFGVVYGYFILFASRRKKGFVVALASGGAKVRELRGPASTHFDWVAPLVAAAIVLIALWCTTLILKRRRQRDIAPRFLREEYSISGGDTDWSALLAKVAKDADYANVVRQCWFISCGVLAQGGRVRLEAETPSRFARRVGDECPDLASSFLELTTLFNLARFSSHGVGEARAKRALTLAADVIEQGRLVGV